MNYTQNFEILLPHYHVKEFKYSKDFLDKFLNDLKNKTIRVYEDNGVDIEISMSSSVYEKLKENQKQYDKYDFDYEDDSIEDLCEELEDRGYDLPDYCHNYNHHNM